jgi:acetyl-CoA synthetase
MPALPLIEKTPLARQHNLRDYDAECASFRWEDAAARLTRLAGDRINIAVEALDRHADGERAQQRAIRFLAREKPACDFTFAELRAQANRFANVLESLGVQRGERVATLCGRIPELYFTALGALKAGGVYLPLFSAFGPEPIQSRLEISSARVLVTTDRLYKRKVAALRSRLPELKHVLLVREDTGDLPPDTRDLAALLTPALDRFATMPMKPEELALLHFTSGTTGKPKGVMHVHAAVIAHEVTARFALDLQDDDVYWCTADPGWVTGTSYGIIAPLVCGVSMIVDQEEFDAERWYSILANENVSVWYTAPTAIRMLMKVGIELAKRHTYRNLRFLASVGEPLNPEGVMFGMSAFGMPFHDNWWQTETGGIMVANYASMDVRPGSMGKPMPGVDAAIVKKRDDGGVDVLRNDEVGELALKPGWPSMFRGYLNEEARYQKCFAGGWYFTGDLARRDADDYYWFVGRSDDVIKSSGHLISPFEVESAIMTHPAVTQVGVIGIPDPIMGEVVKAFVELKAGNEPSDALNKSIMATARKLLGAAVAPREIVFSSALPRTRSGKIMRRLLKARELGLPEGDISTLEGGA